MHILPNISKYEGNQTTKFCQAIEYNARNYYLEKYNTKCFGEPSPRPFYNKPKLSIPLDQQSEMFCSWFHCTCMSKWKSTKIY